MKTYRSPREVLASVEQVLAPRSRPAPRERTPLRHAAPPVEHPLDEVAAALRHGRHYFSVGIYLVAGPRLWRRGWSGPESPCLSMALGEGNVGKAAQSGHGKVASDVAADPDYKQVFAQVRAELVTPIKIASHVHGVIDVESEQVNALGGEDRVLLQQTAALLARFLVGRGKYLLLKTREQARLQAETKTAKPARFTSSPVRLHAAAGEKSRS